MIILENIIYSIYREEFLEEFTELLQYLVTDHADYGNDTGYLLLMGDFNFHIHDVTDRDTIAFLELVSSFGLRQHVTDSTHRSGRTLDLVFTRSADPIMLSTRVEDHGFPDHYPVFIDLTISRTEPPTL